MSPSNRRNIRLAPSGVARFVSAESFGFSPKPELPATASGISCTKGASRNDQESSCAFAAFSGRPKLRADRLSWARLWAGYSVGAKFGPKPYATRHVGVIEPRSREESNVGGRPCGIERRQPAWQHAAGYDQRIQSRV